MTDATTPRSESITDAVRRATADRLPALRIDAERIGPIDVRSVEVDGNGARAFLVVERATGTAVLVDPTGDRARVLELVYDAQDAAEDAGEPVPAVAAIALPRPRRTSVDGEASPAADAGRADPDLVARLERRLGAPAIALAPDGDDATPVEGPGDAGGLRVRLLPLRGADPQGAAIAIEATGAPTQLFVGEALGASGPARLGRDRVAAMQLVMDLERNLLAGHPDDAVVRPRRAPAATVGELRRRADDWRRGYGLPVSTAASPVWFTPSGRMLRLRRLHADPAHPDHRFVMLMIGATVHAVLDPDDPFSFVPAFGVYPAIAAFLGLEPPTVADADRSPVKVLHLGAGALAIPRMISAARPDSQHEVVDLEPTMFAFVRANLPWPRSTLVTEHVGDARDVVDRFAARGAAAFDAIVVDVFDGLSVPRQISSVDAFATMRSLLARRGLVLANLPVDPGSEAARVVVAGMLAAFEHVAIAGPADVVEGRVSGNVIAVASDAPVDSARAERLLRERHAADVPHLVLIGDGVTAWIGVARALRDDD